MDYITAEQFLRQPEKVQKVFTKWFCENIKSYVLYETRDRFSGVICLRDDTEYIEAVKESPKDIIPLLSETQLRKFVEEKTNSKMEVLYFCDGYSIRLTKNDHEAKNIIKSKLGDDLLQAYWQVACKIANE